MSLITIEVHDEQFQQYLTDVQLAVHNMWNTLQEVAKIVELQSRKFVPVDTTRLEQSFVAFPTGKSNSGFVEVEIGYSTLNSPIPPVTSFDYAEYVHTGIDWRTGRPINFHKVGARDHFLWWGMFFAERKGGAFELIEGDYLSIWRKGG